MAEDRNRLRQRIFPEIDYTVYDDIITQLLVVTVCPITKEVSNNNIIFNNQCYDRTAWEQYVQHERMDNLSGVRRGTRRPGDNNRLKCPHTGDNFVIREALRTHYFEEMNRRQMKNLIEARIGDLKPREWQRFAPNAQSVSANDFSAHLINLGELGKAKRELYNDYVRNRQDIADASPSPARTQPPTTNTNIDQHRQLNTDSNENNIDNPTTPSANVPSTTRAHNSFVTPTTNNISNDREQSTTSINVSARTVLGLDEDTSSGDSNESVGGESGGGGGGGRRVGSSGKEGCVGEGSDSERVVNETDLIETEENNNGGNEAEIVAIDDDQSGSYQEGDVAMPEEGIEENGSVDSVSLVADGDVSVENAIRSLAGRNPIQPNSLRVDNGNVGRGSVTNISIAETATNNTTSANQTQTWSKETILAVDRQNWSWPPNFERTVAGQSITLAMVTAARNEGYGSTLDYPHRTDWFERMFLVWYQPLGLLSRFKVVKPKDLRLKFRKCENNARRIYDGRMHQPDSSGERDETEMPLYYEAFRHYFDYCESPVNERALQRQQ